MPLSENEQRILSEIEAQLYESDPALAREVGSTTVYTQSLRKAKISVVGFVIGIVGMILALQVSYLLAFCGFIVMLVSALSFERNARHLSKTGIAQIAQNLRSGALRDRMPDPGQRFRNKPDTD